jgi:hypothetical protein
VNGRRALYLDVPHDPRSVMVISGLVQKFLGPALKYSSTVAAPIVAVLAWGAVEDEIDKRKYRNKDDATTR